MLADWLGIMLVAIAVAAAAAAVADENGIPAPPAANCAINSAVSGVAGCRRPMVGIAKGNDANRDCANMACSTSLQGIFNAAAACWTASGVICDITGEVQDILPLLLLLASPFSWPFPLYPLLLLLKGLAKARSGVGSIPRMRLWRNGIRERIEQTPCSKQLSQPPVWAKQDRCCSKRQGCGSGVRAGRERWVKRRKRVFLDC